MPRNLKVMLALVLVLDEIDRDADIRWDEDALMKYLGRSVTNFTLT